MRRVLGLAVPGYRMPTLPSGDVNNHKQAMTELLSGCGFFYLFYKRDRNDPIHRKTVSPQPEICAICPWPS